MNTTLSMKRMAPSVLRWGMSAVFIWFGLQQLTDAASWIGFVPDWMPGLFHLGVVTIVHLNGVFELVFGFLLLIGLYTRLSACLLALHMLDITSVVGYGAIGARDFGLAVASIVIFMHGADEWGVDALMRASKAGLRQSVKSVSVSSLAILLMLSCACATLPSSASAATVTAVKKAIVKKTAVKKTAMKKAVVKKAAQVVKKTAKKAVVRKTTRAVRKVAVAARRNSNGTSRLLDNKLIDPNNPPGGR